MSVTSIGNLGLGGLEWGVERRRRLGVGGGDEAAVHVTVLLGCRVGNRQVRETFAELTGVIYRK